jgi:transposase
MSDVLDLSQATGEELLRLVLTQREALAAQAAQLARQQALIGELQATIAQQAQRIGALAQQLQDQPASSGPAKPPGLAGNKLTPAPPAQPKHPRKKRAHNTARARMVPTARLPHTLDTCPQCGTALGGGTVRWCREVLDVPVAPVTVTAHQYGERRCPRCHHRCLPPVDLAGVVVGRQRLGLGLVSLITTLREEGRWPFRLIQWYLRTFHDVSLSVGGLVGAVQRVATQGQAMAAHIRHQIRRSAVVNVDETGWRENGVNGYVWTFSTPEARYFVRRGRNKEVRDAVLGDRFDGVIVSDFYGAYDHYPGVQQRCWAHLLRDVHDVRLRHPTDAPLGAWATSLPDLFNRAVTIARSTAAPGVRRQYKRQAEHEATALCQP